MASPRVVLCFLGSLLLGAIGCGGGSGGSGGGGGGQSTTVTVNIAGPVPTAVATQIGAASFTPQSTAAIVTLSLPSGTTNFAVAAACPAITVSGGLYSSVTENVFQASTEDGTSFAMTCPRLPTTPQIGILTGSVDASAIASANYIGVAAASGALGTESFLSGTSANFSLPMPAGTDRVAVAAYDYTASNQLGADSVYTLAAVRNFPSVAVPGAVDSGSTITLGASDAVTMQPITYQNVPTGYSAPGTLAFYLWSGGGDLQLSNQAATQYPVIPAAAAQSGDSYQFLSIASSNTTLGESAEVETAASSAGPLNVSFPSPWTYAGPQPATWPVFTVAYNGFAGEAKVVEGAYVTWPASTSSNVTLYLQSTANHQGASTSLAIPDLSSMAGFAPAPASGARVIWGANVCAGSLPQLANGTTSCVMNQGLYSAP